VSPRGTLVPGEPRRPNPTDGAVVYRTYWSADLAAAAAEAARHGIPAAAEWRATHMPAGLRWRAREGDGEGWLIVPAVEVERARAVLATWKGTSEARVSAHARDVAWQLGFVLWIALILGAVPLLVSPVPHRYPIWVAVYGAVFVGLGLYVLRAWRRSRARP
jgi:hypothetical protein